MSEGRIWSNEADHVQGVRLSSPELGTNFGTKFRRLVGVLGLRVIYSGDGRALLGARGLWITEAGADLA